MVRVLHDLGNLDGGGVARLLYDYYSYMDHDKVHFDFVISTDIDNGILEKPFEEMGCKIYKIPSFKKDKKTHLKSLRKIITNGNYDVLHTHKATRGLFSLFYAKKHGIKRRIVHSHIAFEDISNMSKMINRLLAKINMHLSTHLFACGIDAGIYMWGEKRVRSGIVHIMRNAVDTEKFCFSQKLRDIKRNELNVEDKFVIGIVGRLTKQKNQTFLLRAFSKLIKKEKNVVLLLIGRGEDEQELLNLADELQISQYVRFVGVRNDVDELLNALDLFVLPSLYEGLPVVLVEAQSNGLYEIVSDKITKEIYITDLVKYLPIDDTEDEWAIEMAKYKKKSCNRAECYKQVEAAGYDIKKESMKMQNYYLHNA